MTNDPKILTLALASGLIPSLLWLWFWIKEESKKAEPKGILAIVFIMGMIGVICVLPIQKFIQTHVDPGNIQLVLYASAEEIIKYLAVIIILYKTHNADEPADWPIYLITAALGFAALENALFLIKPLSSLDATTVGLLTGGRRFLGATLLHAVSSGILGMSLGLSLHMPWVKKSAYAFWGLILAITLHSIFNFFIMKGSGGNFLSVFGFLWVIAIINILIFEKLKRMSTV